MAVSMGRGSGAQMRVSVADATGPGLRGISRKFKAFSSGIKGDLSKITPEMGKVTKSIGAIAKGLGTIVTGAAAAGAALFAMSVKATRAYGEYNTLTRRAVSLTGDLTESAVRAQTERERAISLRYGLDRNLVSTAYYQATSAGARGQERENLMNTAAQFQIASGVNLDVGSAYLQGQANVFGLSARRVGDITRAVEEAAVTTIPELVEGQGQFLPQTKELGMSLEEGLNIYGAGTLQGLKPRYAASGTGALLRELINPESKLAKLIKDELGESAREQIDQGEKVIDILSDLRANVGAEAFAAALTSESQRIALPLVTAEGAKSYRSIEENLRDAQGKLDEVADFVEKSPQFIFNKAKAAWDDAVLTFGAEVGPAVTEVLGGITEGIRDLLQNPNTKAAFESFKIAMKESIPQAIGFAIRAVNNMVNWSHTAFEKITRFLSELSIFGWKPFGDMTPYNRTSTLEGDFFDLLNLAPQNVKDNWMKQGGLVGATVSPAQDRFVYGSVIEELIKRGTVSKTPAEFVSESNSAAWSKLFRSLMKAGVSYADLLDVVGRGNLGKHVMEGLGLAIQQGGSIAQAQASNRRFSQTREWWMGRGSNPIVPAPSTPDIPRQLTYQEDLAAAREAVTAARADWERLGTTASLQALRAAQASLESLRSLAGDGNRLAHDQNQILSQILSTEMEIATGVKDFKGSISDLGIIKDAEGRFQGIAYGPPEDRFFRKALSEMQIRHGFTSQNQYMLARGARFNPDGLAGIDPTHIKRYFGDDTSALMRYLQASESEVLNLQQAAVQHLQAISSATDEIADNTAPQRNYQVVIANINSNDEMLVGG